MRVPLRSAAAVLALACAPLAAQAQNPSSDAIINALRPGAGIAGGTRGIRPVGPEADAPAPMQAAPAPRQTPRAHPPAHAAAAAPRATTPAYASESGGAPSVNLTVQFRTGSADLTPAATRALDELGRALASPTLAGFRFRIEGHTDTVGSPESNKQLSQRRAEAVIDYLVNRHGVDRSRLEAVGLGEEKLLVQTPPNMAEPRNRRVQVVNLGA